VPKSNHPTRSRRSFLTLAAAAGSAALVGLRPGAASAQANPAAHVSVNDPLAKSLGYAEDGTKVDKAKFPTYKAGQKCGNCRFYQGAAGQPSGPCQIFGNMQVNANGWCISFNAKT